MSLPELVYENLLPTRDRLRDVCQAVGSLQRAFLPAQPRQWEYGLEVSLRGLTSQAFSVRNQEQRVILDLVRHKVRLAGANWLISDYSGPELLKNFQVWLESHEQSIKLQPPTFTGGRQPYDEHQASLYTEALWWFEVQFRELRARLKGGVISPILLYPHHFDLALSWFPLDDERQFTIGWSTGDEHIPAPYVYVTAYPEPAGFQALTLPAAAQWQNHGFSGAVLTYDTLQHNQHPESLLAEFAYSLLTGARQLL